MTFLWKGSYRRLVASGRSSAHPFSTTHFFEITGGAYPGKYHKQILACVAPDVHRARYPSSLVHVSYGAGI